ARRDLYPRPPHAGHNPVPGPAPGRRAL
ncbi:MAG: hypothetical protein AVDCRST_MAG12-1728, partial [uncultured Rubrobacteraceae bacterium]